MSVNLDIARSTRTSHVLVHLVGVYIAYIVSSLIIIIVIIIIIILLLYLSFVSYVMLGKEERINTLELKRRAPQLGPTVTGW